jgi:hypothetical protein
VAQTVQLAPDVVGVDIELPKPLDYLPGQYCKLQFQGFRHGPTARPFRWKALRTITCCTFTSEGHGRTGILGARPEIRPGTASS